MFFKYDNLKYYFMGNLVFKREGKGQQKRTGVQYLKAVGNACAANPKLCKLVIHTLQLPKREKKAHNGRCRSRNNYKRVPTSPRDRHAHSSPSRHRPFLVPPAPQQQEEKKFSAGTVHAPARAPAGRRLRRWRPNRSSRPGRRSRPAAGRAGGPAGAGQG